MAELSDLLERLKTLLGTVRLGLEAADHGGVITWESRRYPVADLCLDGVDVAATQAELLAVAAAFEAAVKYPGRQVAGEDLRTGAAALLPKLERARFARAYDAVVLGRAGDLTSDGLYVRDFGGGLVTACVQDEGWKFNYLPRGRVAGWDASVDTVHSVGRSNLYHKAALDHRAREVAVGDGYDAARAIMMDDVFYDRAGPEGIEVAIPGRDLLMVGPDLDPAAVRQAYDLSKYPISPEIFWFKGDRLSQRTTLSG